MINQNMLYYGHHSLRHGQYVLQLTMIFSPRPLIITTIPCHYLSGCLQSLPLPRENVDEILHCFRITGILYAISLSFLFLSSTMLNRHEPSEYEQLLATPEFVACKEMFIRAGWHSFLTNLQGHDDAVSL